MDPCQPFFTNTYPSAPFNFFGTNYCEVTTIEKYLLKEKRNKNKNHYHHNKKRHVTCNVTRYVTEDDKDDDKRIPVFPCFLPGHSSAPLHENQETIEYSVG